MRPEIERRLEWALLVVTAGLGLIRLGASDVIDPGEARTIGVVQDVLRGHVLWPTFNDGVVPPEPPGFHWLAAAVARVAGFSELAVRLPSVAAWVGLVALTIRLGRDFGAAHAGLVAGLLLAASPGLAGAARSAEPHALLACVLTASMLFAWRWLRNGRRLDAGWAIVLVAAATFVGGPTSVILLIGVVGWTLGWRGQLGRTREFFSPVGIAVLVVGCGAWYLGGARHLGEAFVSRHLGVPQLSHLARAFVWEEPWSERSLFYHLLFHPIGVLRMTLPWTPLALAALWTLRDARARRDPRIQFLLTWAAAPLLVFMWSRHKQWSDIAVSLPPLAILAAQAAVAFSRRWPRPMHIGAGAMASAGVITLAALAGASLVVYHPGLLGRGDRNWLEALVFATGDGGVTLLGLAGLAGGLGAGVGAARAWPLMAPALVALGLGWNLIGQPAAEHGASQLGSLRPFAFAIAEILEPDDSVVFMGRTQRPLVVYLDRIVPSLQSDPERLPTGAFIIMRARTYDELAAGGRLSPIVLQGGGRMHDGLPGHLVLARVLAPPPPPTAVPTS